MTEDECQQLDLERFKPTTAWRRYKQNRRLSSYFYTALKLTDFRPSVTLILTSFAAAVGAVYPLFSACFPVLLSSTCFMLCSGYASTKQMMMMMMMYAVEISTNLYWGHICEKKINENWDQSPHCAKISSLLCFFPRRRSAHKFRREKME